MSATPQVITGLWCPPQLPRWSTARAGTTRPTLGIIGTVRPTPTAWEWLPRGVQERAGASRSVSDIPMAILTTTLGGDRGGTTDLAAGGRPGAMAMAGLPPPMCMAAGAIPRMRAHTPLGRI